MSESTPEDVTSLRGLATTLERQRDWPAFVEVCRKLAAHPESTSDAVSYLQKAAVATESHLKDQDAATEIWRQVIARDPDNRYAFGALRRLFTARREWEDLEALGRQRNQIRICLQAFEEEAKNPEAGDRLDLLLRIGRLQEEAGTPSSRGRAQQAFEEARSLDPGNREAAMALARLYDPEKQPRELLEMLRVAGADDEAVPLFRRAAAAAEAAGDPDLAIEAYGGILARAGDDLAAVAALVRLYAAREDWQAVGELIVARVKDLAAALLDEEEERRAFVTLVAQVGDLEESLGIGAQALDWYQRALEIDPADPRLALPCERIAEATEDPTRKAELLAQAAGLWRQRGESARAFNALIRVVVACPYDEAAIAGLEEAAALEDRWEEVAQAYRDMAAQPLSLDEQIQLRLRLARIYGDEIGDEERAVKTYERVIDLSPSGQGIEELARLYEKRRRHGDLYRLLREKLRPLCDENGQREVDARVLGLLRDRMVDASPAERAALANEMLASEVPDENTAGFEALLSLLTSSPVVDRPTLKVFEKLAEKTQRWDDYLVTCEEVARRVETQDPGHAVELWLRVATAYEVRRDDTASALIAAERASQLDPERLDLLVRRAELHRRREEWQEHDRLMAQLGHPSG